MSYLRTIYFMISASAVALYTCSYVQFGQFYNSEPPGFPWDSPSLHPGY